MTFFIAHSDSFVFTDRIFQTPGVVQHLKEISWLVIEIDLALKMVKIPAFIEIADIQVQVFNLPWIDAVSVARVERLMQVTGYV